VATTQIDRETLRHKYAEERDKRLRPDGVNQYTRLADRHPGDNHMPVNPRPSKTDHVTVALIGGGMAGLLTGARLRTAGVDDVRIIDKAGDFGGVWYWNRYPGAMCDTASMVYMPLLEETGYMPSEKYAHGPEIRQHCQRIAKQYGLYDDVLFHTEVTELVWQEDRSSWLICTNRGDRFTAQFVAIGTGPLHVAQLPGIPGIDTFQGRSFHTTEWDYAYTGGDDSGASMDQLADRRVAVIGTGATAIQCVPELAKYCKELVVFQRTPSAVAERGNHPIDPQWFAETASPGWQHKWTDNFATIWDGVLSDLGNLDDDTEDLVQDGWTALAKRMGAAVAAVPEQERTLEAITLALEDADHAHMDTVRARADDVVTDPDTADKLKAWYQQLCKRPCFHDEYLQSFNRPNTHLIDTDGMGVEQITESGVVAGGKTYNVDLIVYATGFEFYGSDFASRCGFEPLGRNDVKLSEHWADGMRTLHSIHVHGFPNMFLLQLFQGAFIAANIPHAFVDLSKTIAQTINYTVDSGFAEVEATKTAEDAWVDMLLEYGRPLGSTECTPGYYNNEGREPDRRDRLQVGYPQGIMAFFKLMDEWRDSNTYEGLDFSRATTPVTAEH
jgi:cyclohexanone monooxygenase